MLPKSPQLQPRLAAETARLTNHEAATTATETAATTNHQAVATAAETIATTNGEAAAVTADPTPREAMGTVPATKSGANAAAGTPRDTAAEELYGYQLLRAEGECSADELTHYASVRAATPSFLDTEILSGQTYTYAVQPYDRRGVRGPRSAPLCITLSDEERGDA